jgi:Family of unknown function (DUF6299)
MYFISALLLCRVLTGVTNGRRCSGQAYRKKFQNSTGHLGGRPDQVLDSRICHRQHADSGQRDVMTPIYRRLSLHGAGHGGQPRAPARTKEAPVRIKTATRLIAGILLTAGMVLVGPLPAQAAPPSNDTFAGAIVIGSVPFTTTTDTTEATTDADDANANANCGAPATDASVWYSITPAADGALLVDVTNSDYPAGVLVVTGTPGSFEVVACGPGRVGFSTTAGTTYHLLIIDDQSDGEGNGGTLRMTVEAAPPPPTIDVTVDPIAQFNPRTGAVTLHGTVNCSGVADFAFVDVELRQRVGRGEVYGGGSIDVTCDGADHRWSVEIYPFIGTKFAGGKGASVTFAVACGPVECSFEYEEHRVQLSRRG